MIDAHRRTLLQFGLLAAAGCGTAGARAQALPDVAKVIVGFPPGGAPDLVARRLADALRGKLATAVVVDNRPGAAGRIAVDVARQSPADGLTLMLNPAGVLTVNPHTYKSLSYKPFDDLAPVGLVCIIDFGFAVGPAVPETVQTLKQFAAWAQANPGKVSYGSPSAGAPPHFVGDVLNRSLALGMTHVPYRGGAAAMTDLMGGQIAAVSLTLGDLLAPAKAGKVRILATSGDKRSKYAAAVPTFAEQGVAGLDLRDWFAAYIAGRPAPDVVARVAALVHAAVSSPEFAQGLVAGGLEAVPSTPQELDRLGRSDFARWAPVVKASGFVADV